MLSSFGAEAANWVRSLAPGIKGHSIISIQGDGDPTKGDDGVVKYKSDHSCQGHSLTIEEVRRILLLHLGAADSPDALTPSQ